MSNLSLHLSSTDFGSPIQQPLLSPRFWVGNAVAMPLWLAVAVAYLLIEPD